ncbi:hypothetical protein [Actinoplanes sp. NPDC023714]|uniref:hypothetical protein n=1 Tax=Actinoplanes sp. NPDC023714 TaxID=3154322 RepID=UPI0033FDE235
MADPEFRALFRDYDAAHGWPLDDPGLPALAARTRHWSTRQPATTEAPAADPAAGRLAAATASAASPAWRGIAPK